MKRIFWSWHAIVVVAMFAMAGTFALPGPLALAQEQDKLDGPIVEIAPAKDEQQDRSEELKTEEPGYWIGLRGRGVDDPVLRTQLQLAEDMGVVVEDVVPESPAEKAGLRQHDIILRANGDVIDSMEVLQNLVQTGKNKPIELKILRLGKETDITVTPTRRPDELAELEGTKSNFPGRDIFEGELGKLFGQLQGGVAGPGGMRIFGPGVILNGRQFNLNEMPLDMSLSISRENDGPAEITVRKGEKTWTFSRDDAKAVAELPEDVRNFVSGILGGQMGDLRQQFGNLDLEAELRHWLPKNLGNMDFGKMPQMERFKAQDEELKQRMNQLEEQIQQLKERLEAAPEEN